jgi:rRNA-processing protein FCF1
MSAMYLIVVDTNILLDFYNVRGRESGLSILKHIDDNRDRFITTNQVEMEFKKNRQRVIVDSLATVEL